MAYVADCEKYRIDEIELPLNAYPTSIVPSHNLVSKSWNDMYGEFHDIPINSKFKVNWVWDVISKEDIHTIFGLRIMNKILNHKSRIFTITTYFPGLGFIEGDFYLGTPTQFSSLGGINRVGSPKWFKMELHWIEVYGERLNSPTDIDNSDNDSRSVIIDNKNIKIASPEDLRNYLNEQR